MSPDCDGWRSWDCSFPPLPCRNQSDPQFAWGGNAQTLCANQTTDLTAHQAASASKPRPRQDVWARCVHTRLPQLRCTNRHQHRCRPAEKLSKKQALTWKTEWWCG